MNQEITQELIMCEDCEQDFPRAEMSEKYYRMSTLWCNECRDSYDPTPQEQWEVTTPPEVNGYGLEEWEV
jgi:hypothetical protein